MTELPMIEIDGYRDLARIGAGGLGDVYRARRISTGSTVAIKVLRDVSDSSVAWHRTRRELTALVALSGHAHVIGLLELLDLPSGPALVMEYAPGGSVAGLLARRDGRLSIGEAVLIGRQTAAALVAAHADGIVHRDLKPQNLLIDGYGQVKLCDFGISSLARSEEFRTRTSAWSMRYASPEDLEEDVEVGTAADVYSLGATLLHLVHGAPPTLKERLTPWQPPSDATDTAPIDEILAACLQPEPEQRPTAATVLEHLETLDWTLDERCRALEVVAPAALVDGTGADDPPADEGVGAMSPSLAVGAPPLVEDDTSSATVVRPDRRAPPAPPRPSATARRRRRAPWLIAAGVFVVAAVAVAWLVGGDGDGGDAEPAATSVTTTPPTTAPSTRPTTAVTTAATNAPAVADPQVTLMARAAGLPSLSDDLLWPFGEVGACLVQVNGVDELMPVDCGEPHDLQRFFVGEISTIDADAPFDAAAVAAATSDECRTAFEPFVGIGADASEFAIAVTRPSAETWSDGDRRFQCLLGVEGAWLVGDAAGSRQ